MELEAIYGFVKNKNWILKIMGRKLKYNQKTFLEKCHKVHGNKYDLSKVVFTGVENFIIVICRKHGEYQTTASNFIRGMDCQKCINGVWTQEEFIEKCIEVHGNKYDLSKVIYTGGPKKIIVICPAHKCEFTIQASQFILGKGCKKCGDKVPTHDEFIERCKSIYGDKYDYSKTVYPKNNVSDMIVICPTHGEFITSPARFINRNIGCPKCSPCIRYTQETFLAKCFDVHGDKYDYSLVEFKSTNLNIKIICKVHNYVFEQNAGSHIAGSNCPKCSKVHQYTTEEYVEECIKKYGDKYDYSETVYVGAHEKIIIICKVHNEKFTVSASGHLCDARGCQLCAKNKKYTNESFIEEANKIHGDKYDYSLVDIVNSETLVKIRCKKHDFIFEQTPIKHIRREQGCPICGGSQKLTKEIFIKRATDIHGDKYDFSSIEFINGNTHIIVKCNVHNVYFSIQPSHILSGHGCKLCANDKVGKINSMSQEEFLSRVKDVHGDKYDLSEAVYVNIHTRVKIICREPAHEPFFAMPMTLWAGGSCPMCKNDEYSCGSNDNKRVYVKKARTLSRRNYKKLYEIWDGIDYYDGEFIKDNNFEVKKGRVLNPSVDHKISLNKAFDLGMTIEEAADISNLCITKLIYNIIKHKMTEDEFKKEYNLERLNRITKNLIF